MLSITQRRAFVWGLAGTEERPWILCCPKRLADSHPMGMWVLVDGPRRRALRSETAARRFRLATSAGNVQQWRACGNPNSAMTMPHPYQNVDITGPALDFVHLAAGMMSTVRVEKGTTLQAQLQRLLRPTGCASRDRNRGKRRC